MTDKYYLTDEWKALRKQVLERDNYTCQLCGVKLEGKRGNHQNRLIVHHIIARWHGGEDKLENLDTLCNDCHNYVHWHVYEKRP